MLIGDGNEEISKAYTTASQTGMAKLTADSPMSVAVNTPITREEAARMLARVIEGTFVK